LALKLMNSVSLAYQCLVFSHLHWMRHRTNKSVCDCRNNLVMDTLWMYNFYNSPELVEFMKSKKNRLCWNFHANRKNVTSVVRNKKLKKEEHCGSSCVTRQETNDCDNYIAQG
jgi:hypothetical protein